MPVQLELKMILEHYNQIIIYKDVEELIIR